MRGTRGAIAAGVLLAAAVRVSLRTAGEGWRTPWRTDAGQYTSLWCPGKPGRERFRDA
jgi:hypothetical protein